MDVLRRLQHVVHRPPSERIDAVFAGYDSPTTTWIPYSEARIFTSLAVAMLARDGKISLDDPVRRHVPEVPAYAGAGAVRQFVHHTSGLADYGSHMSGFDVFDRMSEDEFFRILARWGKLGFPPGRGHTYSNTDYALLRLLTEIGSA